MQETELYVAGLKNHVIIHQGGNQIYHEGNVLSIPTDTSEQVQHLVVDGQVRAEFYYVQLKFLFQLLSLRWNSRVAIIGQKTQEMTEN